MLFFIEMTDTFGGEANYSWVSRLVVNAKSERGAARILGNHTGLNWRNDGVRWNSKSGATCAFIEPFDEELHERLTFVFDCRD